MRFLRNSGHQVVVVVVLGVDADGIIGQADAAPGGHRRLDRIGGIGK